VVSAWASKFLRNAVRSTQRNVWAPVCALEREHVARATPVLEKDTVRMSPKSTAYLSLLAIVLGVDGWQGANALRDIGSTRHKIWRDG
jgi:hypothetical protein